jgi:hypothetical protein
VLKALGRAYLWRGWLESGEANSYDAIARKARVTSVYVRQLLPLAFLAPDLTRQLLDGWRRPKDGLRSLLRTTLTYDWERQRADL